MKQVLQIAQGFALPIDAVTTAQAILAKRGAGKSNAAVVMAEEMYKAGVPWVSIDPKGDWWGMRSSADGKKAGLPLIVFGGRHGDLPLEPTAGAMLADLVLEHRLTCILDVSEFTKADTRRFLVAFAERLYRQADREPLHLFLEEAHEYLPQQVRDGDAPLVGVWQKIVKQGRFKGIGCTLITQRSASLNKDVLTQVDTLMVMRTTSPQDRAAVKAWVDVHLDSPIMMDTLPSLASGEAWIWSPEFLGKLERVQFRRRQTFDSGATPKVGEVRRPPTKLADIDLGAIKDAMAATIERAQGDDPKLLRARIAQLEKQLKAAPAATPVVERVEVQVPFIPIELPHFVSEIRRHAASIETVLVAIDASLAQLPTPTASPPRSTTPPKQVQPSAPKVAPLPEAASFVGAPAPIGGLNKAESAVLNVLAQFTGGRTRSQLAVLSGYSAKSSSMDKALSKLRTLEFINRGDPIKITDAGLHAAGEVTPLPTGRPLLGYWLNKLNKAERALLVVFVDWWPAEVTRADLEQLTGYSASSSSMDKALSKLRTLEFIVGMKVNDDFAEAIQE